MLNEYHAHTQNLVTQLTYSKNFGHNLEKNKPLIFDFSIPDTLQS